MDYVGCLIPTQTINEAPKKEEAQPFLQHQEWVKFQQSISVDGFETGQVTTAKVLKKSKGGRRIRRKKEREMEEWQAKQANLGLGKFPAIRYSPEETERLLAEAMATLPKREGKRGTRNLKRQKRRYVTPNMSATCYFSAVLTQWRVFNFSSNWVRLRGGVGVIRMVLTIAVEKLFTFFLLLYFRWFLVRKIRAKQKRYRILEHERKMERRHQKRQAVLNLKEETPQIRKRDSEYQEQVLRHWAQTMVQDQSLGEKESIMIKDEE